LSPKSSEAQYQPASPRRHRRHPAERLPPESRVTGLARRQTPPCPATRPPTSRRRSMRSPWTRSMNRPEVQPHRKMQRRLRFLATCRQPRVRPQRPAMKPRPASRPAPLLVRQKWP
jgi:hypothetical protein